MPKRSVVTDSHQPANQVLSALPREEYQRLKPFLEVVSLEAKQVLFEPGDRPSYVYFPAGAMISLVGVLESGSTVEIALVGKEGMTSVPALLGDGISSQRGIVQISGSAIRLETHLFEAEFHRGGSLQKQTFLYLQALLAQVAQGAVCNRLHTIDERLARWLLSVQDGIQSSEFRLTQEFIAEMIGIRRSSVTVAAGVLQHSGIIHYTRGRITILDRKRLEGTACDCYRIIQQEFLRLSKSPKR